MACHLFKINTQEIKNQENAFENVVRAAISSRGYKLIKQNDQNIAGDTLQCKHLHIARNYITVCFFFNCQYGLFRPMAWHRRDDKPLAEAMLTKIYPLYDVSYGLTKMSYNIFQTQGTVWLCIALSCLEMPFMSRLSLRKGTENWWEENLQMPWHCQGIRMLSCHLLSVLCSLFPVLSLTLSNSLFLSPSSFLFRWYQGNACVSGQSLYCITIRSSDNDSSGFWTPSSLHTLGADGHI